MRSNFEWQSSEHENVSNSDPSLLLWLSSLSFMTSFLNFISMSWTMQFVDNTVFSHSGEESTIAWVSWNWWFVSESAPSLEKPSFLPSTSKPSSVLSFASVIFFNSISKLLAVGLITRLSKETIGARSLNTSGDSSWDLQGSLFVTGWK